MSLNDVELTYISRLTYCTLFIKIAIPILVKSFPTAMYNAGHSKNDTHNFYT